MGTYKETDTHLGGNDKEKISMIEGNLPNTFGLKKESIKVNPVGTYFTYIHYYYKTFTTTINITI